jgi:hypothetical protein
MESQDTTSPAKSGHSGDSPDDRTFTCEFKCKNFQLIPKSNHKDEHPASLDFWVDVERRKTWDLDTDKLLEDCSIDELRESGAKCRLPVGVKSIRTTFFFRENINIQEGSADCDTSNMPDEKQNESDRKPPTSIVSALVGEPPPSPPLSAGNSDGENSIIDAEKQSSDDENTTDTHEKRKKKARKKKEKRRSYVR